MIPGPLLFARYAYPPNALGYCGPRDHRALLEQGATGVAGGDLAHLARGFEGAWPYLELIAGCNRIGDALDRRVVEAYWVGNDLLRRVDMAALGGSLVERFRARLGRDWKRAANVVLAGAVPHHSFHVLGVYPWVGLLRGGRCDRPLEALDRCRIRWGQVASVAGALARVRTQTLSWDGVSLGLGPERTEEAVWQSDGYGFVQNLRVGDLVSLHWEWICDRITPRQAAALRASTLRNILAVNAAAGVSAGTAPA